MGCPGRDCLRVGQLPARAEPGAASQRLAAAEQALRGHPGRGSGWLTSMSSCFPSHQPPDHQGRADTLVEPFEGMKCAVLDLGCSSDGENLACRWPLVLNRCGDGKAESKPPDLVGFALTGSPVLLLLRLWGRG